MKILKEIKKRLSSKIEHPIFLKFLTNGNKMIGSLPALQNSAIHIYGANNILFCEKDVTLSDATISFYANNSLVYLCSGTHRYNVSIHNNSVFYVGKNNYFSPYGLTTTILISEGKNIFIGNNNLFACDTLIRTADPHLIYDSATHKRLNLSKSVYVGDHVWVGQDTTILKGAQIHSGSVIGTKSLVTGKTIPSNECWGGAPAKLLKKEIFWEESCTHYWTEEQTTQSMMYASDEYIYSPDENTITFDEMEDYLQMVPTAKDKLLYLQNFSQNKNRFSKN